MSMYNYGFDFIAQHAGQPYDKIADDVDCDFWMTVQDTLKNEIVD